MSNQEIESNMRKSVEAAQRNFNTIRTGRAYPSLLDRINVEYYGADTPLKSLATIMESKSNSIKTLNVQLKNEYLDPFSRI